MNRIHPASDSISHTKHPVLIIGAGLNGLAAAYELKRQGIPPVILDGSPQSATPWRQRHVQLRLNTHRWLSHLPGMPIPRHCGAFSGRDDIVAYLEAYERFVDVPVYRNVWIERIEPAQDGWQLVTSSGSWYGQHVIVATGNERVPFLPAWPGREEFTGRLIHAADFGRADRFRNRRVLVVGAGNSGTDVLNHLVRTETKALWVSVRNGPTILPTRVFGFPLQLLSPLMGPLPAWAVDAMMTATERIFLGNLKQYGMPRHPDGVATRLIREGVAPAFDNGFVAALKDGRVTVLPEIERFKGDTVYLRDGSTVQPDDVICATGYRPGLEGLVGHLGILNQDGRLSLNGGLTHPDRKGLWFMGLSPRLSGVFHAARHEAKSVTKEIRKSPGHGKAGKRHPSPAFAIQ